MGLPPLISRFLLFAFLASVPVGTFLESWSGRISKTAGYLLSLVAGMNGPRRGRHVRGPAEGARQAPVGVRVCVVRPVDVATAMTLRPMHA